MKAAIAAYAESLITPYERYINRRRELVATYRGLIDEQQAAFERAHDRGDARAYNIKAGFEERIQAAYRAIGEWDAANPAEDAERQAQAAEEVRSFEASN